MRTTRNRLLSLALLLLPAASLVPGAPRQDGSQDDTDPLPGIRSIEALQAEQAAKFAEDMLGSWNLSRFVHAERPGEEARMTGFLTFQDGFMTLVLHALTTPVGAGYVGEGDLLIQANVSRWNISNDLRLQTLTVMGHGVSDNADGFELEPGGTLREYDVAMDDENTLILTRTDGSQFVFSRTKSGEFTDEILRRFADQRAGDVYAR